MQRVLRCFELISELKINFHKSSLVGLRVYDLFLSVVSSFLGYKVEALPIKYLGLPLCTRKSTVREWNPVIERVHGHLALWKGPLLSSAGRLVLIKSTLSSIPLFYMSMFIMPVQVQRTIEVLCEFFLWSARKITKLWHALLGMLLMDLMNKVVWLFKTSNSRIRGFYLNGCGNLGF